MSQEQLISSYPALFIICPIESSHKSGLSSKGRLLLTNAPIPSFLQIRQSCCNTFNASLTVERPTPYSFVSSSSPGSLKPICHSPLNIFCFNCFDNFSYRNSVIFFSSISYLSDSLYSNLIIGLNFQLSR